MSASLSEKAMLVNLSISQWTARKYDRKVSKEVAENYGTDQDRGRYNKVLIAQEEIKKVSKSQNAARTFHYEQTLPWKDDGARILPSANYLFYTQEMRRFKAEFEATARNFVSLYPALIEDARRELNGLFDAKDYPEPNRLALKFAFELEVDPLPTAADFRVNLQGEEVERIREQIETRLQEAETVAMKDLFDRLFSVVRHMADKLADKTAVFRDSLVTNIQDLIDLLPRLNLTGDTRLEALRLDVADKLLSYEPDELRQDQFARQETAQAATDILAAMAGYTNAA